MYVIPPSAGNIESDITSIDNLAELIPQATSYIFNAGGAVWGLDWCPIYAEDRACKWSGVDGAYDALILFADRQYNQYIAVAPFQSQTHSPDIGVKCLTPSHACIQIWSLGCRGPAGSNTTDVKNNISSTFESPRNGSDEIRCELVLCVDQGPANEIKWCPLPSNDSVSA